MRVLIVLLALVAGVSGFWVQLIEPSGWLFWSLVVAFVLSLIAQSILGVRAIRTVQAVRADMKVLIFDQLAPLTRSVILHAARTPRQRPASIAEVLMNGANCATGVTEARRVRASIFHVDTSDPDALVPWDGLSVGRGDEPKSRFVRGTPEGDEVWLKAEAGEPTFCKNTRKKPPPHWDATRARKYETFITVPIVRASGSLFGLLAINAPKSGDLSEDDVGTLQVIAGILASAVEMSGP